MSHNSFGHLFRVTTFGESHGPAIGCVVDGCPPLIPLTEADIQGDLDRRRPGQSRFTTQRQEPDQVRIVSGVFARESDGVQVTTGTPIGLMIDNVDQRSKDYSEIKDKYRPGHADFTYEAKYGLRDYRAAIDAFQQVVDKAPDHPKAPEALLSIANCQIELKQLPVARKTLEQVVKQYPRTEAAQAARDRLLTMAPAPAAGGAKRKAS